MHGLLSLRKCVSHTSIQEPLRSSDLGNPMFVSRVPRGKYLTTQKMCQCWLTKHRAHGSTPDSWIFIGSVSDVETRSRAVSTELFKLDSEDPCSCATALTSLRSVTPLDKEQTRWAEIHAYHAGEYVNPTLLVMKLTCDIGNEKLWVRRSLRDLPSFIFHQKCFGGTAPCTTCQRSRLQLKCVYGNGTNPKNVRHSLLKVGYHAYSLFGHLT